MMNYNQLTITGQIEDVETPSRINKSIVDDILLVWLDHSIDKDSSDFQRTITQLQSVASITEVFTDVDECVDFITDVANNDVIFLISDQLSRITVPLVHDITQLHTIFIVHRKTKKNHDWHKNWAKTKIIHNDIGFLCDNIQSITNASKWNSSSFSFLQTFEDNTTQDLNRLDPTFMYLQLMKDTLLTIEFSDQYLDNYVEYCKTQFAGNKYTQDAIRRFHRDYRKNSPIWWYTLDSFLYKMLNLALRKFNMAIIIYMGFFIVDLHREIERLHRKQHQQLYFDGKITVYRGQAISKAELKQLCANKGGLISFNNFLSTSRKQDVALRYATSLSSKHDETHILFSIELVQCDTDTKFAYIMDESNFGEEAEILFSMLSIFRITTIHTMTTVDQVVEIRMEITHDTDDQLQNLHKYIREESKQESSGWHKLAELALKSGHPQVAEIIATKAHISNGISTSSHPLYLQALAALNMGQYSKSLLYYEKIHEILKQSFLANHPAMASSYGNIAIVHSQMGEYSTALSYFEKSHEILQQSLPANHLYIAGSYANIALLYLRMGEYSKALSHYEKSHEIRKQSLPANHPDIADNYFNTALLYSRMGEHSTALSYYEKSHEILKQSLPANHPNMGSSYNNIANEYSRKGDHFKALLYYEKAQEILKQSLPANHPNMCSSYNNIASEYSRVGEHFKALLYYEKAHEILKKSLPVNHPEMACSYNKIGLVYSQMGEHSKALSLMKKAYSMGHSLLPTGHPHLVMFKRNMDLLQLVCRIHDG